MPQKTTGPQKTPFSLRQGSESVPAFQGEVTDNDDPANIPPGSFRQAINIRLRAGAIFPRGGRTKVNTIALASAPIGLHLLGDGFLEPLPNSGGVCGSEQSGLFLQDGAAGGGATSRGFLVYYPHDNSTCLVRAADSINTGAIGGLYFSRGGQLMTTGRFEKVSTPIVGYMRATQVPRGPYPQPPGLVGVYSFPVTNIVYLTDAYAASAPFGYFDSMVSLPETLSDNPDGELFFVSWARNNITTSGAIPTITPAATDYSVYKLFNYNDESAVTLTGETVFGNIVGVVTLGVWNDQEILAFQSNYSVTSPGFPPTNTVKRRNVSAAWAYLTYNWGTVFAGAWSTGTEFRNIRFAQSFMFGTKLWVIATGLAWDGANFLNVDHPLLFSYDGTTWLCERIINSANNTATGYGASLFVNEGVLYYAWASAVSGGGPSQRAFIGKYDGTTFTDAHVDLALQTSATAHANKLTRAAGRWYLFGGTTTTSHIATTATLDASGGWAVATTHSLGRDTPSTDPSGAVVAF